MPSGFIALTQAGVLGLLLGGLAFSLFAARFERTPGPIFAFGLLAAFAAASLPFSIWYNDARDLHSFLFAFSAHSLLTRGAFIAWIFYLHALSDFTLKWPPRLMYAFEATRAIAFVANPSTPYFLEIRGIERVPGPFGDTVTRLVADPAPLHFLQVLGALLYLGYVIVALVAIARIGRRRLALLLAGPFVFVVLLILVDNLGDSLGSSSIYLTELGFPLIVFALTASLMEWVFMGQRAREALVEHEARMIRVLDAIADGVVVCDRNLRILRVNPVARELAGGAPVPHALLLDQFGFVDSRTSAPPSLGALLDHPTDLELRSRGPTRLVRVTMGEVKDRAGSLTGYVVVMHDITERERRERLGRRDETMRALGELAGGVAHDFNNYLAAIGASARLLEQRGQDPRSRERILARIGEAVAQASSLTRRLLDFSREGEPAEHGEPRIVSINEVVEGAAELIRTLVGGRIEVVSELRAQGDLVRGSAHELQSALLNLGKNAADAIVDTGTIRIVTDTSELTDGSRAVTIAFSDDGVGISSEDLKHIFEPFFTTKELGEGTGFGLPSVHRIVAQHGGTIEVVSAPGAGTTFTLTLPSLPRTDDRAENRAPGPRAPSRPRPGGGLPPG